MPVTEIADLKEIHKSLILKGKHSEKFKAASEKHLKGAKEKYTQLDNIDKSGSINLKDAEILFSFIREKNIKTIFEIGTWFGTSAFIMAMAAGEGGMVYTCDTKDYYVAEHENIQYFNGESSKYLRTLKGVKFDFVFIDGSFIGNDAKKISEKTKIIGVHDYMDNKKGVRNIRVLKKIWGKCNLIKPVKGSTVAFLIKE